MRTHPGERKLSREDHASIEALLTEYAWLVDHDRSHQVQQLRTGDPVIIAPVEVEAPGSQDSARRNGLSAVDTDDLARNRPRWTPGSTRPPDRVHVPGPLRPVVVGTHL